MNPLVARRGTQPDWLVSAALSSPGKLALRFEEQSWTFAELLAAVDATASTLDGHRRTPSGRVGVVATNRPGVVLALHAARRLGAEIAFFNWRQTPDELAWQIEDSAVDVLLADEDNIEAANLAVVDSSTSVVPIELLETATAPNITRESGRIHLSEAAMILYTSGTSGRPKGARLTFSNLWHSAIASALHLGHHRDDVWLAALPLFHIGGLSMLLRSVICRVPVVLQRKFDPERLNAHIDAGATLISLTPTMAHAVLQSRITETFPDSLRVVLLGGSASPASLVESCLQRGMPVAPTYGLTEAASQATTLLPGHTREKLGSSGQPLPGTEVRIVDSDGAVATGEIGQIEIRGPTVFRGYLGHSEYQSAPAADRWFQTGDAGFLDDQGYLYVVDRRDDLIISGGENIYPAEVERVLLEFPGVTDAAVVGVADSRWGARPVAFIAFAEPREGAEQRILDHCRSRLASFKVPVRVQFMSSLPRSASGKLLRRVLRQKPPKHD